MSCFQDFANSLPALAVCIVICWSYYEYVVVFCVFIITDQLKRTIYLIVYHICFVMLVWSFIATACCKNDGVPPIYKLGALSGELLRSNSPPENMNQLLERFCRSRRIMVYTTGGDGKIRFCKSCEHVKPDRAHHCSTCERCILKMDHHCPWVNNCIGYSNYKQFVLFLLYATIYCAFALGTVTEYVIQVFTGGDIRKDHGYHVIAM